jgi:hypothetical protein
MFQAVRFTDLETFWIASLSTEVLGYCQSSASPDLKPTFCAKLVPDICKYALMSAPQSLM